MQKSLRFFAAALACCLILATSGAFTDQVYAAGSLSDCPSFTPHPTVNANYYYIIIDKQKQIVTVLRRGVSGR